LLVKTPIPPIARLPDGDLSRPLDGHSAVPPFPSKGRAPPILSVNYLVSASWTARRLQFKPAIMGPKGSKRKKELTASECTQTNCDELEQGALKVIATRMQALLQEMEKKVEELEQTIEETRVAQKNMSWAKWYVEYIPNWPPSECLTVMSERHCRNGFKENNKAISEIGSRREVTSPIRLEACVNCSLDPIRRCLGMFAILKPYQGHAGHATHRHKEFSQVDEAEGRFQKCCSSMDKRYVAIPLSFSNGPLKFVLVEENGKKKWLCENIKDVHPDADCPEDFYEYVMGNLDKCKEFSIKLKDK
jgi:hypothetical protein